MRCGRCGNENAESNRFCGMCGAPLVAKTTATAQAAGPGPVAAPVAPARTEPKSGPVITGPSFLGLNLPAVDERGGDRRPQDRNPEGRRSESGRDPLQPSSRNLDYLLEDEEEPKRGPGKLILVVVALLLALGFGYLRWKQGGFDWLNASKKPAAATPQDAGQSGADSGSATAATPNGANPPQAGASGGPATAAGGTTPADSTTAQTTPPATGTPGSSSSGNSSPNTSSPATSPPGVPQDAAPQTKPNDSVPKDSAAQPAPADADKQPAPAEAPATAKPVTRKPAPAKPAAGRPFDVVAEAERYIYGRGVRQDCEHGMRLLKSAEQSNPKAMISLGAVYSTGTCAPRDLPTAYRWFALALHKEPDNQALQDDLQKLWSQMTPPERQLAIKLSQ